MSDTGPIDAARLGLRRAGTVLRRQVVGLVVNPDIQAIRDLLYLMVGQVGVKLIGFAAFAFLARRLSTTGYGVLETLLAWAGIAALVIEFGLNSAAVRYRAQHAGSPAAQRVSAVVPAIRAGIAVLCALVIAIGALVVLDDDGTRSLALLLSVSVMFNAWNQEWLLQSLEQVRSVAIGQFLRVAVFATAVFMLVRGPNDMVWVGVAELAGVSVWTGYHMVCAVRAGFRPTFAVDPEIARPLLATAAPLGLNAIVWGIVQFTPTIIVGALVGPAEAAFFATAQRLVTSLQTVSFLYHFNLFAALSRRSVAGLDHLRALSMASMRVVSWGVIGPAIACAAISPAILTLIYGDRFGAAWPVLAILIFVVPVQFLSGHHRWALIAAGHTRAVLNSGIAGAAVTVAGCAVFSQVWGAAGGAVASLGSSVLIMAVSMRACRRHGFALPVSGSMVRPVLVACGAAVIALALTPSAPTRLFLIFVLYAAWLLIVERRSFFRDLRHVAYAKKNRDNARPMS